MQQTTEFATKVLCWFSAHGRTNLPWQKTHDAYLIWISEVMLQQTQVQTVIPYFERFISKFPTIKSLANASIDNVLALWSGLGYYARARNLHKAAGIVLEKHNGYFPTNFDDVLALPGIGRSTAGAILVFSSGQRFPILDGNVKRVLCRFYGIEGNPGLREIENKLWKIADKNTPKKNVAEYTQAIMDLGATVCVRKNPYCDVCPLETDCHAQKIGMQKCLPTPKSKKSLPTREISMLLILDKNDQILLEKRPPRGIWGGLWSLPECDTDQNIMHYCKNTLGMTGDLKLPLETLKHSFSHYHLRIHPQILQLSKMTVCKEDNFAWVEIDQTDQLGLPKPVKSLISQLETTQ